MKEICSIAGVVVLVISIYGCNVTLTGSGDASKAEKRFPSLPSKLSFMDTVADKIFTGEPNTTSRLGQSIVLGKDINGDGYGDIIIGAPHYKEIQGRVYIYYSGENLTFDVPDFTLTGEDSDNRFGHNVEMADFNNDNYIDVAIGAPGYNSFQGRVYMYYGGPDFDATADKVMTCRKCSTRQEQVVLYVLGHQ